MPHATEAMMVGSRAEIRERLAQFVDRKFEGNWSHFARVIGVPEATVEEWKRAKLGAPRLEHLRRLAAHRLSLDWLFRGVGQMEWETIEPQTQSGALILLLRPILARLSEAGEMAGDEAFSQLLIRRSNDQLLEMAASGLLPMYGRALDAIARRDTATRTFAYFTERLELLEREAGERGDVPIREIAREIIAEFARIAARPEPPR